VSLALIDYGAGNLHSVHNALKAAGAEDVIVTADPDVVAKADRIVLPGVGAFAHCMGALNAIDGMVSALHTTVLGTDVPFLGVCVGMQLMAEEGVEHGTTQGLGWISGKVQPIEKSGDIKIPHMGWNDVVPHRVNEFDCYHDLMDRGEAYYLHGYHFDAADLTQVIAMTNHGGPLVAAVGWQNMIGVQFHPEKSQAYGINFLKRFLEWRP
jgi:imidazole glycerol-phosphate synthase subunit HisH